MLLERHRKARCDFAKDHKDWTVDDWCKVIRSDETKINRIGSGGKQYCWIKSAGFSSKLVRPTMKYGGGSIMIWGSMMHKGIGTVHVIQSNMTALIYIDILEKNLLPLRQTLEVFNDINKTIF